MSISVSVSAGYSADENCFLAFVMVILWNWEDHYIFALSFVLSSSFFLSSPNLSRRRLDVCHTSTHGVALL